MAKKRLSEFTVSDAQESLRKAQPREGPVNEAFIQGDHWQGGRGWIGPMPGPNEPGAAKVVGQIMRGFVSRNAVLETVQRHANALIGREPRWGLSPRRALKDTERPTNEEQALIDEAEAVLTEWWNTRGAHEALQRVVELALHQERGVLRLFIPEGRLRPAPATDGQAGAAMVAQAATVELALDMVHLDTPHPTSAGVFDDPYTMDPVSLYVHKDDDVDVLDITFVRRNDDGTLGDTVYRRVKQNQDNPSDTTLPLGGRLLLGQLKRPLMINQQVQEQQRALNLAESMIPKNVITGGFLERIMRGAQIPGHFVADNTAEGGQRWVPGEYETGPGTTQWLKPIVVTDAEGRQHLSNPDVTFRDPISPKASIDAGAAHYRSILHEVDQVHHLITGDAIASAVSRVEARVDFMHSLRRTQTPLERLGRWLIEAVLAVAEAVMGEPGKYTEVLRADFVCRMQLSQLSAEEQRALMEMVQARMIPREDAMSMLGTDDVDVALAKINGDPTSMLAVREQQAKALRAWLDAGVIMEVAVKLLGLTEEDQKLLLNMDPGTADPDDPAAGQPTADPEPEPDNAPA